ncbi:hypothetical protein CRUP_000640, partial [Coryphaenoides rupestris]
MLSEMSGAILIPAFLETTPATLDCTWKITLPAGYGSHIQFPKLFPLRTTIDFLEVRAGPQHSSALMDSFTGAQNCQDPSPFSNGDIVNNDYSAG